MRPGLVMLVGPGGAGKTTIGALLALRLGFAFIDLDEVFSWRHGDISEYIRRLGYDAYASANVETLRSLLDDASREAVIALSSGFMTYADQIDPGYARLRLEIDNSRATLVLIPSLDLEVCVRETVRRQSLRSFSRGSIREAIVIRERFGKYTTLRAAKVETMLPPDLVVDACISALGLGERENTSDA